MSTPDASGSDPRSVAISGEHMSKSFGHVRALIDADVKVHKGEVVALFGDNGAGKSTFVKLLLGIIPADGGNLVIDGQRLEPTSVRDTQERGVDCVHQDLALAPDLSIVDNMFLGHELLHSGVRGRLGSLARREMTERSDAALQELGIKVPSLAIPVRDLSGGQRQAVAVARAVMWAHVAVLMDEPTAALGARQSEIVCDLMRTVAERGLGVLVVSHDLPRVLAVADRVAILWRGRTALEAAADTLTVPDVVATMVGYTGRAA